MASFSQIISFIRASMPELNSASVAGVINKEAEAIGQALDITVAEIANSETIITDVIVNKNFGHNQYYTDNALAYQEGVSLSVDPITKAFYYATVDVNKQIIAQAAFKEVISGSSVSLVLKVAYVDPSTGLLAKLPTDKKTAFDSYFSNFEIPGLPVDRISDDPNILAFDAAITYEKTFDLTTLQSNISAALLVFRNTFQFNGIFYNYFLENYLVTNVPGVLAVFLSNTTIDTTPSTGAVPFSGTTILSSGYFNYGVTTINYASV
jgi:hypothetical protein